MHEKKKQRQIFGVGHTEINTDLTWRPQGRKRARADDGVGEPSSSKKAETEELSYRQLMDSFEREIEYRICNKIRACIKDNGGSEDLRKSCQKPLG